MDGYFSLNGHPMFKISVFGHSDQWTVPVEAMLDTGFTGFLSLPLASCLRAGLILTSTADYTLADGSVNSTLLCLGTIVLEDGKRVTGAISVSFKSRDALLGMEFLNKLGGKLELDSTSKIVRIVDIKPTPK